LAVFRSPVKDSNRFGPFRTCGIPATLAARARRDLNSPQAAGWVPYKRPGVCARDGSSESLIQQQTRLLRSRAAGLRLIPPLTLTGYESFTPASSGASYCTNNCPPLLPDRHHVSRSTPLPIPPNLEDKRPPCRQGATVWVGEQLNRLGAGSSPSDERGPAADSKEVNPATVRCRTKE
jgi:hypothetical protein